MKTPTSRAGSSPPDARLDAQLDATAGFTLVEVLATLVVLAMAASLVSLNTSRSSARSATAHLAVETASRARLIRHQAIRDGRDKALLIDLDNRRIGGGDTLQPIRIGPQVDVDLALSANERVSSTVGAIRFFANGASTGGTIRFGQTGKTHEVRVNWFTGRVSLQQVG